MAYFDWMENFANQRFSHQSFTGTTISLFLPESLTEYTVSTLQAGHNLITDTKQNCVASYIRDMSQIMVHDDLWFLLTSVCAWVLPQPNQLRDSVWIDIDAAWSLKVVHLLIYTEDAYSFVILYCPIVSMLYNQERITNLFGVFHCSRWVVGHLVEAMILCLMAKTIPRAFKGSNAWAVEYGPFRVS